MLVKNNSDSLEIRDELGIRGSSTPHRIKIPNNKQILQNNDKHCVEHCVERCVEHCTHPNKRKAAGVAFSTLQQSDKCVKSLSSRGRKRLPRSTVSQNLITNNHKLTEYFPVRRSVRKCKKAVLEEKQRDLENKVLCGIENGLQVKYFVGKGRGVVTTRDFSKGEFVVEYIGELIDQMTAKKREIKYAKDQNAGCYMYYFQYRNQQYCVDATSESAKLGRLVNHSRNGNLATRIVEVGSVPHLVLIAKEDILAGTEVSYDYGDRSRESIRNHPWLAL